VDQERLHAELDADARLLSSVVVGLDPERPLPTCPQWRPADLVAHVGRGHRWAAELVETRATRPVPIGDEAPPGRDGWTDWLVGGARRLSDAVREAGPDAAVWTWSVEQTAGFWLRRMVHDQLVHRVDAEVAAGLVPAIAPDLAADGVTDLLESIAVLSTGVHGEDAFDGLRGEGETLHLHATDEASGEWFIRRTPAGVVWEHGHRKADVAVRGPAADLLLVLNRRALVQERDLEVLGNRALFEHWIANSAF
jgi:uncharacterized protein (TIGR03083 family)